MKCPQLLLLLLLLVVVVISNKKISFFDSAIDVYKDMAAGTAQINVLSDFFQEKESDMKSKKKLFEGDGFDRNFGYPIEGAMYDNSKPVDYDYSMTEEPMNMFFTQRELIVKYIIQYYYPKAKIIIGLDKDGVLEYPELDAPKIIDERIEKLIANTQVSSESKTMLNNMIDYNIEFDYNPYKSEIQSMYDYVLTQKIPQEDSGSLNPLVDGYAVKMCAPDVDKFTCIKQIFGCDPNRPWSECDAQLETCKDDPSKICKYAENGSLIKKFEPVGLGI